MKYEWIINGKKWRKRSIDVIQNINGRKCLIYCRNEEYIINYLRENR